MLGVESGTSRIHLSRCLSALSNSSIFVFVNLCHVSAYIDLREGKSLENDEDLIVYFTEVMKIREKLKLQK